MATIDRCLLASLAGTSVPDELSRWIDEGLAGVVIFARNIVDRQQLDSLVGKLRAHREDLIIAVDEEGGDVTRLHARQGSPWPGNAALGAAGEPDLTCAVAADIGAELAAAGINLDFAPVADVSSCRRDPVIGVRSFGQRPDQVAAHTAAFVTGLQSTGVAACAKHFPGHGGAHADSHLELPTVDLPEAVLRRDHLAPFAAAVAAGVASVMTAHVRYPALDPSAPATTSGWLLRLLREELGFTGVVVSDALEMRAIAGTMGVPAGAAAALAAGVDLLCLGSAAGGQREVRDALAVATRAEPRLLESLDRSADRVRALAAAYPAERRAKPAVVSRMTPAAMRIARRALVHDVGDRVPIVRPIVVVDGRPPTQSGIGLVSGRLAEAVAESGWPVSAAVLPRSGDFAALPAGRAPVLVVRDAHLDPAQAAAVRALLSARSDGIVVGVGTAHDAELAPGHYLGTRGSARPNLMAAAEVLTGRSVTVIDA